MPDNQGLHSPSGTDFKINDRSIQGFAKGSYIVTERITPEEFTVTAGVRGDFTFGENLDKTGRFKIILTKNAPDNAFLQTLKDAKVVFKIVATNLQNYKETASGLFCMVELVPRFTISPETTDKEWSFVTGNLIESNKAI